MAVSGPSSASLNPNFVPQSAWNPPGFIAAKLLLGVSDQVGSVITVLHSAQSPCKGLILTCVPWLGSNSLFPTFSSFS